jgi:GNAT superfamily N-acetyltransferase
MPQVDVSEIESPAELKQFILLPNRLYKNDPNYVAPLISERLEFFDREKNPFFKTSKVKLFLARRDGKVVGRIAICVNYDHNEFHAEQTGFFGFFDCGDDYEVASTMLKVAMITLKKEGMTKMRGPMNFSTNHECGFLVEGFDSPPVVMMTYNPPYLPQLAEKFGLKKAMDLLAYKLTEEDGISERIEKVVTKLQERASIKIRTLDMKNFDREVQLVRQVYNGAWENNWGFVPLSEAEFEYTARNLKQVVEPDLVFIAEHEGRPVAFSLALPDVNQALRYLNGRLFPFGIFKILWHTKIRNKIDQVRLVTFGVIPEFQKRGIDSMMYLATWKSGVAKGYRRAELSWILENNDLMRRGVEQMNAHVYKRYRVVEMPI